MIVMAEPLAPDAAAGPADADMRMDLDAALQSLSPAERACVSLCHGAGLTGEEIASALDVPLGTVKSHIARGLAKLRRRLGVEEQKVERKDRT